MPRSFRARLGLIALAGLALRLAYLVVHRGAGIQGDALTYWVEADRLANGDGFRRVFEDVPTAEHPPLHIVLLAAQDWLGIEGYNEQKILLCVVGTLTCVLLGLVGRRLTGREGTGLLAAGLAAFYPNLWVIDGSLMSETTYVFLLAAVLLAAYRFWDDASLGRGAVLGALIALAALTRAEAVALVVLLLVPLTLRVSWRHALAAVLAFAMVLAPWTIRNLATFEKPVLISTNGDGVWAGANCERSYYGDLVGSWVFDCFGKRAPGDESEFSKAYRARGLRYMKDHLGRVPVVIAARAGRMLNVFRPRQEVFLQTSEGRSDDVAWLGIFWFWAMLPVAVLGAWRLGRRGWPLLTFVALSVAVCLTVYGSTRLRVAAEPALILLAAAAFRPARRPAATPRAAPSPSPGRRAAATP